MDLSDRHSFPSCLLEDVSFPAGFVGRLRPPLLFPALHLHASNQPAPAARAAAGPGAGGGGRPFPAEAGISVGRGGTFPAAGFFILASYRIPTLVQHECGAASAAPSFLQTFSCRHRTQRWKSAPVEPFRPPVFFSSKAIR